MLIISLHMSSINFSVVTAPFSVQVQESEYQAFDGKEQAEVLTQVVGGVARNQDQKDPSLMWVLTKTFGAPFLFAGLFKLFSDLLTFASPQILK